MAKTYRIRVDMDLRPAEIKANQMGKVFEAAHKKIAEAAARAERTTIASSNRQAAASERAAERAAKAEERKAELIRKQAEKEAAAADRRAERQLRREERMADQIAARAEREAERVKKQMEQEAIAADRMAERRTRVLDREADKAARKVEAERLRKERQIKKELTDEQVALEVRNKIVDNANKRRVRAALDAAGVERKTWSQAIVEATNFNAVMTKTGVALLAMRELNKAVQAIGRSLDEAQRKSEEFFNEMIDNAADLRELANIEGKSAPDIEMLQQQIRLRRATGMTRSEATTFSTELGNSLGTVSQERLSDEERKKLVVEGGKFAARGGGGPQAVQARAAMLGMLPNYLPKGSTAKDVVAYGTAIDQTLQKGSASQQVMTEQYRDVLTGMTSVDEEAYGFLKDPRQAAALVSIASAFDKTAPAHAVFTAARQARKFTNFRKVKGMTASATETLTKAGVKETDDPIQSMVKMFQFAKANIGEGEAFDAFLARRGFRETQSNRNLAKFYDRWKAGDFDRIVKEAQAPIDPNAADRLFEQYAAGSLTRPLILRQNAQTAALETAINERAGRTAMLESEEGAVRRDTNAKAGLYRLALGATSFGTRSGREIEKEQVTIERLRGMPGSGKVPQPFGYGILNPTLNPAIGFATSGISSLLGLNRQYIDALAKNTEAVEEQNRLMKQQPLNNGGVKGQNPAPLRPPPRGQAGVN